MWSKKFWKDTAERVIGTAAATAIPTFAGANAWDIDYRTAAGITLSASIVTLLKCLAVYTMGDKGTASVLKENEHA